jgi:hypothetical protein
METSLKEAVKEAALFSYVNPICLTILIFLPS